MDKTHSDSYPALARIPSLLAGTLIAVMLASNAAVADHRYSRDGSGYRPHGGDAFGSYKYPRGSTAPGAGLNNRYHRPGDGLNSNRYRDSRRDYPTYRNNRRHDNYNNRRFSSNKPPSAQNRKDAPQHNDNARGYSHQPNQRGRDTDYREGYSRGFERGYSRGHRDSYRRNGDGRVYRQNPYSQNPYYQDRRSYGGHSQRGYGSGYQRY